MEVRDQLLHRYMYQEQGSGLTFRRSHLRELQKGWIHIDSKQFLGCVALSVAGGWEVEAGVLQVSW